MRESGIICIYKEKGFTSHDVVAVVRRTLAGAKTGHTGTLDPMACGVLPVCIGRATKLAGLLTANDKSYVAELRLGVVTDTLDHTGQVLAEQPYHYDAAAVEDAVRSFVGEYAQTPPMYSAIKMNGRKLYELARRGVTVEREARMVRITRADVTAHYPERNACVIEVDCSKGAYIRSLCADIGARLGCGACMGDLTRTRSGSFTVADCITLDQLKQAVTEGRPTNWLIPPERALPCTHAFIHPEAVKRAENGNPVPIGLVSPTAALSESYGRLTDGEQCWLYDGGRLLGLYRVSQPEPEAGVLMSEAMFI